MPLILNKLNTPCITLPPYAPLGQQQAAASTENCDNPATLYPASRFTAGSSISLAADNAVVQKKSHKTGF
jgi:hypothetical protein